MRLKSHAFKTFSVLALAATFVSVLPGPIASAVEALVKPAVAQHPVAPCHRKRLGFQAAYVINARRQIKT
jgi:hypothetical protein